MKHWYLPKWLSKISRNIKPIKFTFHKKREMHQINSINVEILPEVWGKQFIFIIIFLMFASDQIDGDELKLDIFLKKAGQNPWYGGGIWWSVHFNGARHWKNWEIDGITYFLLCLLLCFIFNHTQSLRDLLPLSLSLV